MSDYETLLFWAKQEAFGAKPEWFWGKPEWFWASQNDSGKPEWFWQARMILASQNDSGQARMFLGKLWGQWWTRAPGPWPGSLVWRGPGPGPRAIAGNLHQKATLLFLGPGTLLKRIAPKFCAKAQ